MDLDWRFLNKILSPQHTCYISNETVLPIPDHQIGDDSAHRVLIARLLDQLLDLKFCSHDSLSSHLQPKKRILNSTFGTWKRMQIRHSWDSN